MVALSIPVTLGMLGLVVDIGWAYWRREACLAAAQSAAIAVAVNAKASSTYTVPANTGLPRDPERDRSPAGRLYVCQTERLY